MSTANQPTFHSYLAATGAPAQHPFGKIGTNLLLDKLPLKNGIGVLEVGAGTGATIVDVLSKFDLNYTATDVSNEMLSASKKRLNAKDMLERCRLVQTEPYTTWPLQNNTHDVAFCESVLATLPKEEIQNAVAEIFRIIKPGSVFIANELIWKTTTKRAVIEKVNQQALTHFGSIQSNEEIAYLKDWEATFVKYGFDVLSSTTLKSLIGDSKRKIKNDAYSKRLKAKALLNPKRTFEYFNYTLKKRKLKPIEQHLEARLFICQKPMPKK